MLLDAEIGVVRRIKNFANINRLGINDVLLLAKPPRQFHDVHGLSETKFVNRAQIAGARGFLQKILCRWKKLLCFRCAETG